MGKRDRAFFWRIVASFLFLVSLGGASFAGCADDVVRIKGAFGQARFRVELVDDAQERAQGLMHRTELAASAGMLFVYEHPQAVAFWMRNTLIPLDMVFLDDTGRVAKIHENAVPLDETPIPGGDAIFAVLEINGGMSQMLGLQIGDTLQHPAFDPDRAAWPCAVK